MMRTMWRCAVASMALIICEAPAAAQQADQAALFGARRNIELAALSPDGRRVLYAVPLPGRGSRLLTAEVGSTQPVQISSVDGDRQRLGSCGWVSNMRLACRLVGATRAGRTVVEPTRWAAFNADGSNARFLGERDTDQQVAIRIYGGDIIDFLPQDGNAVLMQQVFVPEEREIGRLAVGNRTREGMGVIRVDTLTGETRIVESPHPQALVYLSDGRGNVVVRGLRQGPDSARDILVYQYRRPGTSEWQDFARFNMTTFEGPAVLMVDAPTQSVFTLDRVATRLALHRLSFAPPASSVAASQPDDDVAGVLAFGRLGRVAGVMWGSRWRAPTWLDPELQRLSASLSRSLPGQPNIRFADISDDQSKLLVFASGPSDPGTYYVFDKTSRTMARLFRARPELDGVAMGEVRQVSYRTSDGTAVPATLTLPAGSAGRGLPAIVLARGPGATEDGDGFDWMAQYYASQGFAVLQPQLRGTSDPASLWLRSNGYGQWRVAANDLNDAARWLVAEGVAAQGKLAIGGWAEGGYLALQAARVEPTLYGATVAIAPLTDIAEQVRARSDLISREAAQAPYGAAAGQAESSPARNAAEITAPVLLFHGTLDDTFGVQQSRILRDRMVAAGRQATLVEYPGLDSYLSDSTARADMLRRSSAFLRQSLGM